MLQSYTALKCFQNKFHKSLQLDDNECKVNLGRATAIAFHEFSSYRAVCYIKLMYYKFIF